MSMPMQEHMHLVFPSSSGTGTGGNETLQVVGRTSATDPPMTWDELHDAIVVRNDLDPLFRSPQVHDRYTQHRLELSQTYDSVYDYILHSKFNLPRQWNPQASRWHVPYSTTSTSACPLTALVPNDFPYCTAPGIEHWVFWKVGASITDDEIAQALQNLHDDPKVRATATIHWENPPHLRSLPGIHHYHILVKTSNLDTEDLHGGGCGSDELKDE